MNHFPILSKSSMEVPQLPSLPLGESQFLSLEVMIFFFFLPLQLGRKPLAIILYLEGSTACQLRVSCGQQKQVKF